MNAAIDSGTPPSGRSICLAGPWEQLQQVRSAIEEYLADADDDLRVAATMAGLELAENILKHGGGARHDLGWVRLAKREGRVVITAQNRLQSRMQADAIQKRLARISREGARSSYMARMSEVLADPETEESGLGLLRIAYEGGFELSCDVVGEHVHLSATRRVGNEIPS